MTEQDQPQTDEDEVFAEQTLTQAIENQLEADSPAAAKATYNKLTLVGYPREEIIDLMAQVLAFEVRAMLDAERPFDHGAWVPLMHLFPQADVPVVQVALPQGAGPAQVYAMGVALRSLREQNVLVVGSGSMTHNLAEFFGGEREPAPYVLEFSRWIEAALARGDIQAVLNYRSQAPGALRAHPTEDHFLPIFFALGAAGDDLHAHYLSREVMYSMLSMDAFAMEPMPEGRLA